MYPGRSLLFPVLIYSSEKLFCFAFIFVECAKSSCNQSVDSFPSKFFQITNLDAYILSTYTHLHMVIVFIYLHTCTQCKLHCIENTVLLVSLEKLTNNFSFDRSPASMMMMLIRSLLSYFVADKLSIAL